MKKSTPKKLSPRTTPKKLSPRTTPKKKSPRRPRTLAQNIQRGTGRLIEAAADVGRTTLSVEFIIAMVIFVGILIFGIVILSLPVSAFMDESSPYLEKVKKIAGGVLVGFSSLAILLYIIFRRITKKSKSFHAITGANILLSPFRGKP
tara:strand:+ start:246 stop:689 length:444 start_codon:yes stop_codon:yes gene_type:complete